MNRQLNHWVIGAVVGVMVCGSQSLLAQADKATEDLSKESEAKCQATAKDKPTPQMIIEKVNKAAQLIEQEGEAAFPKFKGKDSEFIFCGTYIWIHNLDGVMQTHPIKPKMEGKNQLNLKDANGKMIFVDMNKIAQEKGSGWYEYVWPKPGEKDPSTKISYIKLAKKGDKSYVIGCGVYDMTMAEIEKTAK